VPKPLTPIDKPVGVSVLYKLPLNKDGTQPKRPPDLTNLLEATDDILVNFGILADDNINIITDHDGSSAVYTEEEPFADIVITVYENEESTH